jgi:hypothetical protein
MLSWMSIAQTPPLPNQPVLDPLQQGNILQLLAEIQVLHQNRDGESFDDVPNPSMAH